MSFRASLIILNVVALAVVAGMIVYRVVSLRRNPEPRPPANVAEGMPDEDLEGRKLERVLGWALIFTIIIAVALPLYFLVEPQREARAKDAFLERSIERGAVLFANDQSPHYDSTTSLLCANCHGVDGKGGTATFTLQPEADECLKEENKNNVNKPECLPKQVIWSAPDLTLAGLRYDRGQLTDIITYGRPGTPMPAWGVKSGRGSKNEQSIQDLVNYVESIKTTPEKAQADAAKAIGKYKQDARALVDQKQKDLEDAQAALAKAQSDPKSTPKAIQDAQAAVATAQAELAKAIAYRDDVLAQTDGGILFRLNCARCHTKGWSYYMNEPARLDLPPLPPQGSGAYGPALNNGAELLQFPGEAGRQQQIGWVAVGVPAHNQYGVRGISTGSMPHFGQVLTDKQIREIVDYERSL